MPEDPPCRPPATATSAGLQTAPQTKLNSCTRLGLEVGFAQAGSWDRCVGIFRRQNREEHQVHSQSCYTILISTFLTDLHTEQVDHHVPTIFAATDCPVLIRFVK